MKLLDSFSLVQAQPGAEPDRRRFLHRAGGIGAAVVGAIAFTWSDTGSASAAACTGNVYCCDLAHPNGPWCGGSPGLGSFGCPSGYHKTFWTCCCENCCIDCYECSASSSSCFGGPWACSNFVATCGGGG